MAWQDHVYNRGDPFSTYSGVGDTPQISHRSEQSKVWPIYLS